MTDAEFIREIHHMRLMQLRYFAQPSPRRLLAAKQQETVVDDEFRARNGEKTLDINELTPANEIPH